MPSSNQHLQNLISQQVISYLAFLGSQLGLTLFLAFPPAKSIGSNCRDPLGGATTTIITIQNSHH